MGKPIHRLLKRGVVPFNALGKNVPLSNEQNYRISTKRTIKESPQHQFNSQTSRAVVLFGDAHDTYMKDLTEALKIVIPEGHEIFAPLLEN